MKPLILNIEGMSCGHCLNAVNKALGTLDGVTIDSVRIGRADLHFDPTRIAVADIAAAVTAEGYRATAAPGSN